jgi:hypothetical protein
VEAPNSIVVNQVFPLPIVKINAPGEPLGLERRESSSLEGFMRYMVGVDKRANGQTKQSNKLNQQCFTPPWDYITSMENNFRQFPRYLCVLDRQVLGGGAGPHPASSRT